MQFVRPLVFAKLLFPEALFRIKTDKAEICLTFDDGPDPESTPQILDILKNYNVKAVFFCKGQAAEKHQDLMSLIRSNGHTIGNHGFSHINGYKTSVVNYADDVSKAAEFTSPSLFRPPYGCIRPLQYRMLKKVYQIIFWDLMPYDFDPRTGKEKSLQILKKKIRKGSVIVLHDKATSTVITFLKEFLEFAVQNGYNYIIPDFKPGTGQLPGSGD